MASDANSTALRVRKVLAAASNVKPSDIHGGQRLGDPPPLGISGSLMKAMIPALNDIVHDSKPSTNIRYGDIAKLKFVSELIGLVLKKAGLSAS
jgi:hypothetical protein